MQSARNGVEAVTMTPAMEENGETSKTFFHIQLGHSAGDYNVLFFRLLFDDKAEGRPELIARDGSGARVLRSGQVGSGIGLASSESGMIAMNGVSSLGVDVPGAGKRVVG